MVLVRPRERVRRNRRGDWAQEVEVVLSLSRYRSPLYCGYGSSPSKVHGLFIPIYIEKLIIIVLRHKGEFVIMFVLLFQGT